MSEPAGAAGSPIPAAVIPPLTAATAQIAADHDEPSPASIAAVATTQAKALDVLMKGTKIVGSESVHVYALVMTGQFVSYRGGPPTRHGPLTGSALSVILDARTLRLLDLGLGDHDHTALLPALGPVTNLNVQ